MGVWSYIVRAAASLVPSVADVIDPAGRDRAEDLQRLISRSAREASLLQKHPLEPAEDGAADADQHVVDMLKLTKLLLGEICAAGKVATANGIARWFWDTVESVMEQYSGPEGVDGDHV
jgi:hypothetical protein